MKGIYLLQGKIMINENLAYLSVLPLEDLKIERSSFSCSVEPLENYFHRYVSQDVKKGLAKCFVLINEKQSRIVGYYTLSALSISITNIPQERISKGIPYPNIPAVLIGRLAIDTNFQNQGYGKFLIADAIHTSKVCAKRSPWHPSALKCGENVNFLMSAQIQTAFLSLLHLICFLPCYLHLVFFHFYDRKVRCKFPLNLAY